MGGVNVSKAETTITYDFVYWAQSGYKMGTGSLIRSINGVNSYDFYGILDANNNLIFPISNYYSMICRVDGTNRAYLRSGESDGEKYGLYFGGTGQPLQISALTPGAKIKITFTGTAPVWNTTNLTKESVSVTASEALVSGAEYVVTGTGLQNIILTGKYTNIQRIEITSTAKTNGKVTNYDFYNWAMRGYKFSFLESTATSGQKYGIVKASDAEDAATIQSFENLISFDSNYYFRADGTKKVYGLYNKDKNAKSFHIYNLSVGDHLAVTGGTNYYSGNLTTDGSTTLTQGDELTSGVEYIVTGETNNQEITLTSPCNTQIKSILIYGNTAETITTQPAVAYSEGTVTITPAVSSFGGHSFTYYTTDGTEPTMDNGTPYTGPFSFENGTIKVRTFLMNGVTSSTTTATILATPTITRTSQTSVTITAPAGKVYYKYGGNNFVEYTGVITVSADATIYAYAGQEGALNSSTVSRQVALISSSNLTLTENSEQKKSGWTTSARSETTTEGTNGTYSALLLDGNQWGTNIYLSANNWGIRNSGNWYVNSGTIYFMMKSMKAGDIIVVHCSYFGTSDVDAVNATYSEKYSYDGYYAYIVDADGNVEIPIRKSNSSMQYIYNIYSYEHNVATPDFTIASYNYEQAGYTITPTCATEGVTFKYKIGTGSWQNATVPFYAKGGKLYLKAEKEGWTSAEIVDGKQYTLNSAPASTSPETLISFQTSGDDGDKNIEHAYKSVTIAGGNTSAIGGVGSGGTGKLKLRTNMNSNTITLNVNEGYKVTKVSVEAISNNSGSGATIDLTSVTIDGGGNIMNGNTTFPISTADAVTYSTGNISAASNIVFTFDNSNITNENNKKNNQIVASIKVWYKTPAEVAIDDAIADCKANESSAAFATYIDGGSYSSVRDVYVAHTNWQIAQGSKDLTKLIRNAAVADGTDWGGAVMNHGQQYTNAPDEYYLDRWNGTINANQTIYGVPAGTYTIKAATRASAGTPGTLYVNDGSSDIAKVNQITNVGNSGGDLGNGWSWNEMTFTLTETKDLLIGFWADCSNEKWASCDDWHMTILKTPVTVGKNGYTTFASPYALDLTDENRPEGLKAYKATLSGSNLSFQQLHQTVPAGTGLLLLGETNDGTYNIPVVESGDGVETALTGVLTPTAKQSDENGAYYFVMRKANTAEDALTFAPITTAHAVTIPAGKVYITVPSSAFTDGARALKVSFGDDETTGIDNLTPALSNGEGVVYNLNGQRIDKPAKGLYIVNGKKVLVK